MFLEKESQSTFQREILARELSCQPFLDKLRLSSLIWPLAKQGHIWHVRSNFPAQFSSGVTARDQWKGLLTLYFSHSPAPQHQASTGQGGESRFSWQRTEDEPRRNPLILWFGTDHGEYPWSLRIYQTMLPETICLFSLPYFHCYAGLMRWLEPFAPSSPLRCTHPAPAAPLGRSVMWAAIH